MNSVDLVAAKFEMDELLAKISDNITLRNGSSADGSKASRRLAVRLLTGSDFHGSDGSLSEDQSEPGPRRVTAKANVNKTYERCISNPDLSRRRGNVAGRAVDSSYRTLAELEFLRNEAGRLASALPCSESQGKIQRKGLTVSAIDRAGYSESEKSESRVPDGAATDRPPSQRKQDAQVVADFRNHSATCEQDLKSLTEANEGLLKELQDAWERVATLDDSVETLKREKEQLESKNAQLLSIRGACSGRDSEGEADTLRRMVEEYARKLDKEHAERTRAERVVEQLRGERDALREKCEDLLNELRQRDSDESNRAGMEELEERLTNALEERDALAMELKGALESWASSSSFQMIDAMRRQMSRELETMTSAMTSMEGALRQAQVEREDLLTIIAPGGDKGGGVRALRIRDLHRASSIDSDASVESYDSYSHNHSRPPRFRAPHRGAYENSSAETPGSSLCHSPVSDCCDALRGANGGSRQNPNRQPSFSDMSASPLESPCGAGSSGDALLPNVDPSDSISQYSSTPKSNFTFSRPSSSSSNISGFSNATRSSQESSASAGSGAALRAKSRLSRSSSAHEQTERSSSLTRRSTDRDSSTARSATFIVHNSSSSPPSERCGDAALEDDDAADTPRITLSSSYDERSSSSLLRRGGSAWKASSAYGAEEDESEGYNSAIVYDESEGERSLPWKSKN